MPAIDTLSAAADLRPVPPSGTQLTDSTELGAGASDAFAAALLAQGMMPQMTPAATPVAVETGAGLGAGQELPGLRPALAASGTPRRAPTVALAGPTDAPQATALLPGALPAATADAGEQEFAMAFAALQDAMVGGGEVDKGEGPLVGGEGQALGAALGEFGEALQTLTAAAAPRAEGAGTGSEALLAGQIGRAHGAGAAGAPGQVYAQQSAPLPMDQPALFAERLTQHVSVMLGDAVNSATIAVTPPDLGPVEVRVTVVGDEAKIQLAATHQATREALQDALPKLRAALADSGLSLGQAGVFAQMPERQQQAQGEASTAQFGGRDGDEFDAAAVAPTPAARNLRLGLVDAFV
ncbi:MAG: flagellar hook-length control protein FliK [Gammaproteobacteria bacterium]